MLDRHWHWVGTWALALSVRDRGDETRAAGRAVALGCRGPLAERRAHELPHAVIAGAEALAHVRRTRDDAARTGRRIVIRERVAAIDRDDVLDASRRMATVAAKGRRHGIDTYREAHAGRDGWRTIAVVACSRTT